MHIIKWIRKNERKIMAIVVVLLMVGFIGGSYISQLGRGGRGGKEVIAHYGTDGKITNYDRYTAQRELEILRSMQANQLLRSQDLRGVFLGELLFAENRMAPDVMAALKRFIISKGLRISDEQLKGLYRQKLPTDIYWILLKAETKSAGIAIDTESVRGILVRVAPQLFNGASYSQIVDGVTRRGYSQEMIELAFADLFAVLEYSQMVCSNEALTDNQVRQFGSIEAQTLSAELIKFDAELFEDRQPDPTKEQVYEQFEKYKDVSLGEYKNENPYGFGYKLDDMVSLEYIAVRLDDISEIVPKPTQQEKEDFYQSHLEQFTRQVPMDPNDPNSPMTERMASFGQVAKLISDRIYQQRITDKTDLIMNEAKQLIQDDSSANSDPNNLKETAADYGKIAAKLSDKYGITIYAGKTGFLTASDMRADKNIAGLFLKSSSDGAMPASLQQVVFSVEPLGSSTTLTDINPPKLYETIGPLRDIMGKISALARVVEVKQPAVPDSLDVSFSKESFVFDKSDETSKNRYSVREQVIKDLKKLAAMKTAKETAENFLKAEQANGWDTALEQFNSQYPPKEVNEPNTFKIISLPELKKASSEYLNALDFRGRSESSARLLKKQVIKENKIIEILDSLIPEDSNRPAELPVIAEAKPYMSYYIVKDLSVNRLYKEQYQNTKTAWAYETDSMNIQNFAAVFYQPENITKRMNLTFVEDESKKQKKEVEGAPEGFEQ